MRPGVGTEDTRRVAIRGEIGEENWDLVQHLADKRLVVTGLDPAGLKTVEVVHEALIQKWDELREWIEADRAFRTWQGRLRASISTWEESRRNQGALLRGVPLAEAVGWEEQRGGEISATDSEFIAASSTFQAQRQVEQAVNDTACADQWLRHHPPEVIWFGGSRAGKIVSWEQNPDDPLVVTFKACAEEILGSTMDIVGKTAGMDTRFAPYFGIPALSFGPNGENWHGVDEYVDLDSVVDCTKILASFVIEWCGYSTA